MNKDEEANIDLHIVNEEYNNEMKDAMRFTNLIEDILKIVEEFYEIKLDEENNLELKMTLTSPSCPVAETLPPEVEQKIRGVEGIKSAKVILTFEPPWTKEMMSEVAQVELGFM